MGSRFLHTEATRSFAPVAPISVLEGLRDKGALGYYNLVLAHNILEKPERYAHLAMDLQWGTWFVDNSVIELGTPLEPYLIANAVNILLNNRNSSSRQVVAVLPDELLDCDKTIEVTGKAVVEFRKMNVPNMMFVPQGKSYAEIVKCAEEFQNVKEINWIGVAKNFVEVLGTRRGITTTLQSIFPKARFHMLGFSRNTVDDIASCLLPGVEGIDSSMPLRLTDPIGFNSSFPKRGNWWQEEMQCTPIMEHNVRQVHKWLGH